MKADNYLSHTVYYLPINFVCQPDGQLRDKVARAVSVGAVKIIAGATKAHVVLNIKRPYFRGL